MILYDTVKMNCAAGGLCFVLFRTLLYINIFVHDDVTQIDVIMLYICCKEL